MKAITNYRKAVNSFDLSQLRTEFNHVLDQQAQVWAGTRDSIDYPLDGVARRPEYKNSVGPAVEVKRVRKVTKRWPNGSPRRYEGDSSDTRPVKSN